jgi:hypothetical protein
VTIKNRCVACDFVIEAADALRGREVICSKCETVNVLRSAEDAALMASDARAQADRDKRRFLEQLASRGNAPRYTGSSGAGSTSIAAPDDAARSLSVLAGRRLKDVSVYVLALAYVILVLAFLIAGVVAFGTGLEPIWKAFGFLAAATTGVVVFVSLKFSSDLVRALADLTDLLRSIDVRLELLEEAKAPKALVAEGAGAVVASGEREVG